MHLPTHPAPRLSQVLPFIFSVVLIRYYSSMAGLSPARGLAYTPAVRTQPDHASSYHCLHATPPAHHTSTLYAVPAASHHRHRRRRQNQPSEFEDRMDNATIHLDPLAQK